MATFVWIPVYDRSFKFSMGSNSHGWKYLSPEDGRLSSEGVSWRSIRQGDVVKIVGHGYATSTGHVCWNSGPDDSDESWTTWSYDELAFEFASHFPRGTFRPNMNIHLQFCWSAEQGIGRCYMLRKRINPKAEPPATKLLALQRTNSLITKFAGALRHMGFEGSTITGFHGEVLNNHEFPTTVVEKVNRKQYIEGTAPHAPFRTPFALKNNMEQGSDGWYFKSKENQKFFATLSQASATVRV